MLGLMMHFSSPPGFTNARPFEIVELRCTAHGNQESFRVRVKRLFEKSDYLIFYKIKLLMQLKIYKINSNIISMNYATRFEILFKFG